MALGSIAMAALLLAGTTGAPEVWPMNQNKFQIPIRVQPERRTEIRELMLYVSTDQGRTWQLVGNARPDQEAFTYVAQQDGVYWFNVAILDIRGKQEPADIYKAAVGQRILVDTTKPELKLTGVERLGDEVQVSWEVREINPDTATFRMEYQPADAPAAPWTPVAVMPGPQGKVRFKPGSAGPLSLRMQMADTAGNPGIVQVEVPAGTASTPVPNPFPVPPNPNPVPPSTGPMNSTVFRPNPASADPITPSPLIPDPPAPDPRPLALSGGQPGDGATSRPVPTPGPGILPTGPGPGPGPGVGVTPPPAPGPQAGVQIWNRRQLSLDFEVTRFGPSGLGSVEVWLTTDEGTTWERSSTEPTVSLPPASPGGGPVRGTVSFPLPREGVIYGITLVVKSRAGLGRPAPRSGDRPQMRVEVDTTLPEAELYSPQPDATKPSALVLSWKASDRNLATNPISIEWAERAEGPWNFIGAAELPNTGRYTWQVPSSNFPPSVYLRLTVRDSASNAAVAQTHEPILVDLVQPEVGNIVINKGR